MAKGKVTVILDLNTTKFGRGIKRAGKSIKKLAGGVLNLSRKTALLGAVGFGALAAGTTLAIKSFAAFGDEIDKMSKRTGIAAEKLQEYKFATELSGSRVDALEKAVKRMAATIYDAELGLTTATDALDGLGVSLSDLKGQAPERQFEILILALADVRDMSMKSALAQRLFGRAGTQLLPMLTKGAAGLKDMAKQARDLGLVFTGKEIKLAADLTDAIGRLTSAFKNLFMRTILRFVPNTIKWLNRVAFAIGRLVRSAQFKRFQEGFAKVAEDAARFAKAIAGAIAGLLGAGGKRGKEIAVEFFKAFGNLIIEVFKTAAGKAVEVLILAAKAIGRLIGKGFKSITLGDPFEAKASLQAQKEARAKGLVKSRTNEPSAGFFDTFLGGVAGEGGLVSELTKAGKEFVKVRTAEILAELRQEEGIKDITGLNLGIGLPKALANFKEKIDKLANFAEGLLGRRNGKPIAGGPAGSAEGAISGITGMPAMGGMGMGGVLTDRLRRIGGTLGGVGNMATGIQQKQLTQLERMRSLLSSIDKHLTPGKLSPSWI